jgi:hypothetical protein
MQHHLVTRKHRTALLVSASVLVLVAVSPEVSAAADLTPRVVAKAPLYVAPKDEWTWWVEGGAIDPSGGRQFTGLPPLVGVKPRWGWEAAAGFDYKASAWTPYHISGQFRYGASKSRSASFGGVGMFLPTFDGTEAAFVRANGSASIRDEHWLVDFAVGREFALGSGKAQAKLGVRVADITERTTESAVLRGFEGTLASPAATPVNGNTSFQSRSRFLGVGPRIGIDGTQPIAGAWTFDYLAGTALLIGERSYHATNGLFAIDTVGDPAFVRNAAVNSSNTAAIFNLDAQAGFSYWFTPAYKLTASYRFDGYWGALKTVQGNGSIGTVDRLYHGPMLRFTGTF